MLLLIDNGSPLVPQLELVLRDMGVHFVRRPHDALADIGGFSGVILSGGPGSPEQYGAGWKAVLDMNVPVLGICMGHELIAHAFGVPVLPISEQKKLEHVSILEHDPLFEGFNGGFDIMELHAYCATQVPKGFKLLGSSAACPVEVIRHERLPIYGLQGHPEASGEQGRLLLRNFLKMCGYA